MVRASLDLFTWVARNGAAIALVVDNPMLGTLFDQAPEPFELPFQFARRHISIVSMLAYDVKRNVSTTANSLRPIPRAD